MGNMFVLCVPLQVVRKSKCRTVRSALYHCDNVFLAFSRPDSGGWRGCGQVPIGRSILRGSAPLVYPDQSDTGARPRSSHGERRHQEPLPSRRIMSMRHGCVARRGEASMLQPVGRREAHRRFMSTYHASPTPPLPPPVGAASTAPAASARGGVWGKEDAPRPRAGLAIRRQNKPYNPWRAGTRSAI